MHDANQLVYTAGFHENSRAREPIYRRTAQAVAAGNPPELNHISLSLFEVGNQGIIPDSRNASVAVAVVEAIGIAQVEAIATATPVS